MGKTPKKITASNVKAVAGGSATKQRSKEEAELPYQCDICEKRFKSQQGLAGHMNTHKVETIDMGVEEKEEKEDDPAAWVREFAVGGNNQELIKTLSMQERVTFIIPEDPYNSQTDYVLGLNGQFFKYPVGKYIVVPRDIVTQIRNQYQESELAKRRNLADRSEKVQEALTK
jgi:hypothetical protein